MSTKNKKDQKKTVSSHVTKSVFSVNTLLMRYTHGLNHGGTSTCSQLIFHSVAASGHTELERDDLTER